MNKRKVIIIGNDHINTLGVIRSLGKKGIQSYLFIIKEKELQTIIRSKYIKKYWICNDEYEAVSKILYFFKDDKSQPIIIPTSDAAVASVDGLRKILNSKFSIPSVKYGKIDTIEYFMNKHNQNVICNKFGIATAKSQILKAPFKQKIDISFPVIVKPVTSTDGEKGDIRIFNNNEELKNGICIFNAKRYNRILVQELIKYDNEYDLSGFAYNGNVVFSGIIQKQRMWPAKKGSMTFGKIYIDNNPYINKETAKIKKMFKSMNYTGIFDIDLFETKDKVVLNEINFRNGALGYGYGNNAPIYNYYLSFVKNKISKETLDDKTWYIIDDLSDLRNVFDKNITLFDYLRDRKKANILLYRDKKDKLSTFVLIVFKILNKIKVSSFLKLLKCIHKRDETLLMHITMQDFIQKNRQDNKNNIELNHKTQLTDLAIFNASISNKTLSDIRSGKADYVTYINNSKINGCGVIKNKGAKDEFVKIRSKKAHLITSMYINPDFRGRKIAPDIVKSLIFKNCQPNSDIYATVYAYNYPSKKMFIDIGFNIVDKFEPIRIFKKTVNKRKL